MEKDEPGLMSGLISDILFRLSVSEVQPIAPNRQAKLIRTIPSGVRFSAPATS